MKILIIGNLNSPFVISYVNHLHSLDKFDIFILSNTIIKSKLLNGIKTQNIFQIKDDHKKIPIYSSFYTAKLIKSELNKFSQKFDIIHIQMVHFYYYLCIRNLLKKSKKLILSYWGSDVHFVSNFKYALLRKLQKNATIITTSSKKYRDEIIKKSAFLKDKIKVVRFGLEILNTIDRITEVDMSKFKNQYHIPENKIIIKIGTNAHIGQQHQKISDSLLSLDESIKNKIHLILPLTYAASIEQKQNIENMVEKLNIPFTSFKSYLSDSEMAILTKITDILIQIQLKDQLSGIMLEHLYSGAAVITGKWLNYTELIEKNADVFYINEVSEINHYISQIVNHGFKSDRNKNIVHDIASWEQNIKKWVNLYV